MPAPFIYDLAQAGKGADMTVACERICLDKEYGRGLAKLGRAVMQLALSDLLQPKKSVLHREASVFFFSKSHEQHFFYICALCGMNPDTVRIYCQEIIDMPEEWRSVYTTVWTRGGRVILPTLQDIREGKAQMKGASKGEIKLRAGALRRDIEKKRRKMMQQMKPKREYIPKDIDN